MCTICQSLEHSLSWYVRSYSIEYWFRCLDIDGDGVLSLFELVYFYEEILQRLQELNIDCISIENTICQVLDMVNPKEKGNLVNLLVKSNQTFSY